MKQNYEKTEATISQSPISVTNDRKIEESDVFASALRFATILYFASFGVILWIT